MKALDAIDRRILTMLQANGKATNKEIAGVLGMSITPIYERIKKMEEAGYIKAYAAVVDRDLLGFKLVAYCNVQLKEHSKEYLEQFESQIASLEEVSECYHIAGMFDYLLKVHVQDVEAYRAFLADKLAALDNIGNVQSSFVMKPVKWQLSLPVE
ncbi:Lrp/AsnC family transcriptional regulator [Phaeodactylibacter luteus]|uniref:Lrp/AsnC family transcriptional regulator n=1 Tax=Phaeodactylibacter luteus TaxID=1564516 RepID=A0A5C6RLR3_9BACT|nr:Lrp/AsnC family transcriptional regulator [Phaeodactylibacter luteus]TXB62262.1 Lrp/AsnC family transcriptional regulator [Phaeodactylibacter luteus]